MLYSLPNLSSTQVTELDPEKDQPTAQAGLTKAQHTTWATNPGTTAAFVSGFAGLNPHIRVNRTSNPAYEMVALIADYDAPMDENDIRKAIEKRAKAGLLPTYAHGSYNGKGRVIWLFQKPFKLLPGLAEQFLKLLKNEVGAEAILPGLDASITRPEQYYHWHPPIFKISDEKISEKTLSFLLGRALDTSKKYEGESKDKVPLDKVHAKIQEAYPGRWNGPFTKGARGICFWDPESKNPTAAIVTETGMVAFSQPKPFYSWSDLLGVDFIRSFEEDKFGAPLAAYHFDGKYYWHRNTSGGDWVCRSKDDTRQDIMLHFGLSGAPQVKGVLSESDEALGKIRSLKVIDKAIPILYCPHEISRVGGEIALNISRVRVVAPSETAVGWGAGFPWLAEFLDNFFEPGESLTYFLSWLHRFYKSAYDGNLVQGHAIFIAGGVSRGKTLLSNVILGELMGGVADASDFLLGASAWNRELIEKPIWSVDDAKSTATNDKHRLWSAMIKKSVANTNHPYNAKFHDSTTIQWKGRVVCSLNDDPESIRQIPHTDMSILDKIMLFKTSDRRPSFPPNSVLESTIRAELPFFGRYIYDYKIPSELVSGNRFGISSYHHPILLEDTRAMSESTAFSELLSLFAEEELRGSPDQFTWAGSSTALLRALQNTESLKELVKPYTNSPERIGRKLAAIAATSKQVTRMPLNHGYSQWAIDLRPDAHHLDPPDDSNNNHQPGE